MQQEGVVCFQPTDPIQNPSVFYLSVFPPMQNFLTYCCLPFFFYISKHRIYYSLWQESGTNSCLTPAILKKLYFLKVFMPAPAQTSMHNNFFFILCYASHFQHIFVLQILWLTHLIKSPLRSFYFVIQFQHIFYSTIVMNFQFIFTSIFIAATFAVRKIFPP